MDAEKLDVLVVGGGIIGVTLALELQSSGRQVTLLESGSPGRGCSYANAGWVTPCFAMPLPQPGLFWKSIKWLLDPKSPLHIKPVPSLLLFRWLIDFTLSMSRKKMEKSIKVLVDLSRYSMNFYSQLSDRHPGQLGFEKKGLLMVSATDAGLKSCVEEMELMAAQGVPGRKLNAQEVMEMEPCFKPGLKGGVFFSDEAHIDPYPTTLALTEEFKAKGGKVVTNAEVYDFVLEGKRVSEVLTTQGQYRPALLVLAAGTWTRPLAKKIGLNVPLLGGKGYSMTVHGKSAADGSEVKPRQPIMIVDKKIAVTPRADGFRIAGTMELVNQDFTISPSRLHAIFEGSSQHMTFKDDESPKDVWRGLRPCTPDGVPVISYSSKFDNLFLCVGHQMLGLQSAPGSARLAGDLILNRPPITDPEAFSAKRYNC